VNGIQIETDLTYQTLQEKFSFIAVSFWSIILFFNCFVSFFSLFWKIYKENV